jgi:prepilin-type N-terminal cleavage/methylation domain-containing protein
MYDIRPTKYDLRNTTYEIRPMKCKAGFSLIEVLIATVLIGLAVAALLGASRAFTIANASGADLSTAEFLIEQIRERTALLSFDGLNGFASGSPFSPPISADGSPLNDFAGFTQQVTVENVSAANFEQVVAVPSDFVRVTVRVLLNSREISSVRWIRARY